MPYTETQVLIMSLLELLGASLSCLACSVVILTFGISKRFRTVPYRILFFAAINNLVYTISGFIALHGVQEGSESILCRAQAFIIQATLPADTLWNLAVALTAFSAAFSPVKFDIEKLKKTILVYLIICCGAPFITAFVLLFIHSSDKGRVYGYADMWCWITPEWEFLRILVNYGISWVCVAVEIVIYIMVTFKIRASQKDVHAARSEGVFEELLVDSMVIVSPSTQNYIEICILLFISSLMTWVPSSVNRIWALARPGQAVPFPLACTAAFFLQLTGFWNSAVYFMKTAKIFGDLFKLDIVPKLVEWKRARGRSRGHLWTNEDVEAASESHMGTSDLAHQKGGIHAVTTIEQTIETSNSSSTLAPE